MGFKSLLDTLLENKNKVEEAVLKPWSKRSDGIMGAT
jgi:hypothetical protein